MTDEQTELAKRAVACRGFRWMPGMLAVRVLPPVSFSEGVDPSHLVGRAYRVTEVRESTVHCAGEAFLKTLLNFAPDLTDPATLGCLLALVRKAWGADFIDVVCEQANDPDDGGHVRRVNLPWGKDTRGATEAEALVAALEAADRAGGAE